MEITLEGNTWFIENDMWKELTSSISQTNELQLDMIEAFEKLRKSFYEHVDMHDNFESKLTSDVMTAINKHLNVVDAQMKQFELKISEISKAIEDFRIQIKVMSESNISMSEEVSNIVKAFKLQVKTMNEINSEMSKLLQNLGKSVLNITPTISSSIESAIKSFSNMVIESYRQKQAEFIARCDDSIKKVELTSESLKKMREEFTKSLVDIGNLDSLVKRLENSDAKVEILSNDNKQLNSKVDELIAENRVLKESVVKLESDKEGLVKALKELQPKEVPSISETTSSDKETKITSLLKQGKGTMEIASMCDVSPGYVSQIKKKHSI